ncbi:MAG TPA: T9SS type A sorting domain-containing protein [Flavobacteriaceae bacterium]|nr:T9SS type A sorting domain-containing protein [Flavobacteriaceae bacterium]
MIRKLLFVCAAFCAFGLNAQFTVETVQGDPIENGDIFTYGELEASLEFFVYNTSSDAINMQIEFVGATNSDGSDMELCFGLCYTTLNIGQSYPSSPVIIQPGQHQDTTGDHFLNRDAGNGTDVITYEFRFYQLDDTGHEVGNSLTMYYQYDPLLAIDNVNKLDFTLFSTIVSDNLKIDNDQPLAVNIYNLEGKLVKSEQLSAGQNEIQVSDLAAQLYLFQFTDETGAQQIEKIVVQ